MLADELDYVLGVDIPLLTDRLQLAIERVLIRIDDVDTPIRRADSGDTGAEADKGIWAGP
jgi:hypothetical protein